jgi:hypothetical protein
MSVYNLFIFENVFILKMSMDLSELDEVNILLDLLKDGMYPKFIYKTQTSFI